MGRFLGFFALAPTRNAGGIEAGGSGSLESPEEPGLNGLVSDIESGESWSASWTWFRTDERGPAWPLVTTR